MARRDRSPEEQTRLDEFKQQVTQRGWPLTRTEIAEEQGGRVYLGRQRELLPSGRVLPGAVIDPHHQDFPRINCTPLVPKEDSLWLEALQTTVERGIIVFTCNGDIDQSGEPSIWLENRADFDLD